MTSCTNKESKKSNPNNSNNLNPNNTISSDLDLWTCNNSKIGMMINAPLFRSNGIYRNNVVNNFAYSGLMGSPKFKFVLPDISLEIETINRPPQSINDFNFNSLNESLNILSTTSLPIIITELDISYDWTNWNNFNPEDLLLLQKMILMIPIEIIRLMQ